MSGASWLRLHRGFTTDPKWLAVAARAGVRPVVVIAVATALLDYAGQHADRGSVAGFDPEACAVHMGIDESEVTAVLAAMEAKQILVDQRWKAWEKRQPQREDANAASRQRTKRERDAAQQGVTERDMDADDATSRDVTRCHAPSHDVTTEKSREEESRADVTPPPGGARGRDVAVVNITATEQALVERIQAVPGYQFIPAADLVLHLRDVLSLRTAIPETTLLLELTKFRDAGRKKLSGRDPTAAPRNWKNALTNWIGKIDDEAIAVDRRVGRSGGAAPEFTPGTGEVRLRRGASSDTG